MSIIALVNNDKLLRDAIAAALKAEGFTVRPFPDTQSAMHLCNHPVDLAILDYKNHPVDGIELFNAIRACHGMPIIFVSAWATEVERRLREANRFADGYIDTPSSASEVLKLVKHVLEGRHHRF